jgi:hypothetical protein
MGAGGSNYAQNALATLFTEQFRNQGAIGPNDNPQNLQELTDAMANNKARQEGLTPNQELVEQYTPKSTPVGETTEDITRRFTEGIGAVPTPQSAGLQGILDKIAAEKEALKDLTVTETSTRMVPQYEMTTLPPGYGMAGAGQPTYKMVTELPKGAVLRQGQYGSQYYQVPMQRSATNFAGQNPNPKYRQVGSKRITETNIRPAIAGDSVYDKQQKLIDSLQGQYDTRSKYASPNATGIQGLIADPIVSQPQTGYNNINEIMRRYIG